MEDMYDEHREEYREHHEEDQVATRPLGVRLLFAAVALIAAVGMLWTYQLRPLFLYRETPQEPLVTSMAPQDAGEELVVPMRVLIVRGAHDDASGRTLENAEQLIANAEAVWHQANIVFDVRSLQERILTEAEIRELFEDPAAFWSARRREAGDDAVLVVFSRHLQGINGIAWPALGVFAVADTTTVPDWRAYAHELGHVLGLSHTDDERGRLMYQGADGTALTEEEIETARRVADSYRQEGE